ncbi:NAC domain-containing protein 69-like [Mangifera indica]|uniref:NAC domain-containing protein 69-like n=1 Tax=Mangifera indica TaxID=29780 RepID=UPI001CFA94EC|nr:NAC domain-containing protein 69-like [Mangifera indica]
MGYRFHPTEEEIIHHFLEAKMRDGTDFSAVIKEVEFCNFEPWQLPDHSPLPSDDQEWYFFSKIAYKHSKSRSKKIERTTREGFWKVSGKDREIHDENSGQLIGLSALLDDKEWYFFSKPCKNGNGKGIKRTTQAGYWKVTCSDRCVWDDSEENEIGKKTTLVFYIGRGSKAVKTNWMIHEYHSYNASSYQNAFVFCRLTGQLDDDGSNSHS